MSNSLNNLGTIRDYLLGRISDETLLEGIEELLFTDDDFAARTEIVEDELINDFVFGNLDANDLKDFEKTLKNNSARRTKVQVTQLLKVRVKSQTVKENTSIFDSITAFFKQPFYVGTFAILLIVMLGAGIYFLRTNNSDDFAQLEKIYEKERPFEPRISGFDYAPFVVTRGEDKTTDEQKRKLRLLETKLLEAIENNPTAKNHHALGVFYLTQAKYNDSIKELETAVKLDDKNAKFHNDLGSALFEFGKSKKENFLVNIGRANEEFSKAIELNSELLESLFNKALTLQELNAPQQAKAVWEQYLQKDSNSKWSGEARKNLERIEQSQTSLNRKKEDVLNDFLNAYHNQDEKTVWKIHNSTKGFFTGVSLIEQLSQRLLIAKKNKDDPTAQETIEALNYIGKIEKEKHADFFFADLADYYSKINNGRVDKLLRAKDLLAAGRDLLYATKYSKSIVKFEESKRIFEQAGNDFEANISEIWVTQMLQDVDKFDESAERLKSLISNAENKKYKLILAIGLDWLANFEYLKNNFSKSLNLAKKALKIAEESENEYEVRQTAQGIASTLLDLSELDESLIFYDKAIEKKDNYFLGRSQYWRNLQTGTKLIRKKGLVSTSIDFAKEGISITLESPNKQMMINSYRELTDAYAQKKDFELGLKTSQTALENVVSFEEIKEKYKLLGEVYMFSGELKIKMQNCEGAISDFDKSLENYSKIPNTIYNLYDAHKGKLACLQNLQRQNDFETELEIVLKLAEQNRQNIKEDKLRQSFFESQQFVYDAAISNSLNKNEPEKAFEYAEISKARSLLEFVRSKKSISEVEGDFGKISHPLTFSEIQKKIPENVQVVEYALLNNKLAIWKITKDNYKLENQDIEKVSFEKKISDYRQAITEKQEPESIKSLAKELYQILLPKDLEKEKIICLIPDKSLHQIPFASLISPEGKYLIEDFALLYSPSSSVFVTASENASIKSTNSESLLAVGNPQFDQTENLNLKDLPDAETEAIEISKLYEKSDKLLGEKATKNDFLKGLESAEIIHFAGHFISNTEAPGNSKFVFADEYLLSFELSDKKLANSKLAVLSACQTGLEKFNKSEGAIGVARTFLAMGTPLVVASGWKVESVAAKNLMISFHQKRRLDKLSSIEALRQAQLEMLKTNEFSSPNYWSAFSLTGGLTNY
ncbi:MAG TPA: CHAT domain-containing protein [Pyrinomonadaceae bacterium]|nr:CHAT domain-containing protein [Pyrinomonadaceae bacterium]